MTFYCDTLRNIFVKGKVSTYLYFFITLFCLFIFGLRCCAQAFSSCGKRGLLFVSVHGLLIVVASLVVEHGL